MKITLTNNQSEVIGSYEISRDSEVHEVPNINTSLLPEWLEDLIHDIKISSKEDNDD